MEDDNKGEKNLVSKIKIIQIIQRRVHKTKILVNKKIVKRIKANLKKVSNLPKI